jgi:hypothetical protein
MNEMHFHVGFDFGLFLSQMINLSNSMFFISIFSIFRTSLSFHLQYFDFKSCYHFQSNFIYTHFYSFVSSLFN